MLYRISWSRRPLTLVRCGVGLVCLVSSALGRFFTFQWSSSDNPDPPLPITKHTKSLPTLEKSNSNTTMLRRKPTGIKLTTDDIALYEEFKRTRETTSKSNNGNVDLHDTQKGSVDMTPDPKMRQKTRDERMGVRQ